MAVVIFEVAADLLPGGPIMAPHQDARGCQREG
jgi:hypothetical protein